MCASANIPFLCHLVFPVFLYSDSQTQFICRTYLANPRLAGYCKSRPDGIIVHAQQQQYPIQVAGDQR